MGIQLFTQPDFYRGGVLTPTSWLNFQSVFKEQIIKPTLQYFRHRAPYFVRHQHIVNRLLMTLQTPQELPIERYASVVADDSIHVCGFLKITTPLQKGMVFKGGFFSQTDSEIYIAANDYFDAEAVHNNWKSVTPIVPLIHPKTDLSLPILNGQDYGEEKGLSVILVSPAMLAVQYRAFKQAAEASQTDADMTCFLSRYVVPNMMVSTFELAMLNRLINRFYGFPVADLKQETYHMVRPDETALAYADKLIDQVLENITKCKNRFEVILHHIPNIRKTDAMGLLKMPDIMPTRQVDWALHLARLKYYSFLIDVANSQPGRPNQVSINQTHRGLKMYDSLNEIKQTLTGTDYDKEKVYLNNILTNAGQDLVT